MRRPRLVLETKRLVLREMKPDDFQALFRVLGSPETMWHYPYRDIIENINSAVDWAMKQGMAVIYIKHNNLSAGTRTFKPGTKGAELVPELKIVSDHIFVKTKANALTGEAFSEFIRSKDIREFYIAGADATGCVESTCFNMAKAGYAVHVISDCVTSYDLKKMPEMLAYYADKGCEVRTLAESEGKQAAKA